ncbi:MAG: hypothetical protein CVT86_04535 [Alphaproteobacteria bacterium HGW-Alphaproteobacteria-8]|nr:MAG: hypothetical protein CVT86_04535 [Alphaproteobacteria bacterium HGW-Alphaproteobacteria-8]
MDEAARWRVLALRLVVRATMAFQFQAVGALSPLFLAAFADIGLLISVCSAPGIAFVLPGGALAARFGDREIVVGGIALRAPIPKGKFPWRFRRVAAGSKPGSAAPARSPRSRGFRPTVPDDIPVATRIRIAEPRSEQEQG